MYFSPEFSSFFHEFSENNNRDWFLENKIRYEKVVKRPFAEFVTEILQRIAELGDFTPPETKDCIFRINRDIRFSADKTPYKMYCSAAVSAGGRKNRQIPGLYLQFSGHKLLIGGGIHNPEKPILKSIRNEIASDPAAFRKIVEEPEFVKTFGELKGDSNKIVPKEWKEAAEKEPHILRKHFYVMAEYTEIEKMHAPDFADFVTEHYRTILPFNNYLKFACGME